MEVGICLIIMAARVDALMVPVYRELVQHLCEKVERLPEGVCVCLFVEWMG